MARRGAVGHLYRLKRLIESDHAQLARGPLDLPGTELRGSFNAAEIRTGSPPYESGVLSTGDRTPMSWPGTTASAKVVLSRSFANSGGDLQEQGERHKGTRSSWQHLQLDSDNASAPSRRARLTL